MDEGEPFRLFYAVCKLPLFVRPLNTRQSFSSYLEYSLRVGNGPLVALDRKFRVLTAVRYIVVTDFVFCDRCLTRPVVVYDIRPRSIAALPWRVRSHCPNDNVTCAFQLSMYKPGWCGFADLLYFATVGHTTRLFHRHVNMATSPNILLRTCQECSAVTAGPRYKIRTLEIGNTWFATTIPSLHFLIFCQITEFSYGPRLMGHVYQWSTQNNQFSVQVYTFCWWY
jgi:hypothetical protein